MGLKVQNRKFCKKSEKRIIYFYHNYTCKEADYMNGNSIRDDIWIVYLHKNMGDVQKKE